VPELPDITIYLEALDPGGIEVLDADEAAFRSRLLQANHTLKRALTDPHLFSGIGNAYSDEILHRARLSPVRLTQKLTDAEIRSLHAAVRETNYCAPCQTGGKLLADRALSRLLKRDWPRSIEELETRRESQR
jgi:formamidopyrimidine-DNA glycosylase